MTNLKTILTLAAFASLGASALAPTGASALATRAHWNKPANHGSVSHTFSRHTVFHARVKTLGWHRPTFKSPVRVVIGRSFYHRPVRIIEQPIYQAPVRVAPVRVVTERPAYQAAQPVVQAALVNGQNVTLVAVPGAQFSMTEQGHWVEQDNNGKSFAFTEDSRDEWSVYLTDASRGVQLQLDLYKKKVFYSNATSPKRPLYPIVNVAAG